MSLTNSQLTKVSRPDLEQIELTYGDVDDFDEGAVYGTNETLNEVVPYIEYLEARVKELEDKIDYELNIV